MVKNWKTAVVGVLTAGLALLSHYGVITPEAQPLILAFGVAVMGLFTKDSDVTGAGASARRVA